MRWAGQLYQMRDKTVLSSDPQTAQRMYERIMASLQNLLSQMIASGKKLSEAAERERKAGYRTTVLHVDGKDVPFPERLHCSRCLRPSRDPYAGTAHAHVKWCSGCWAAVYCDRDCQKRDWRQGGHKLVCAPGLGLRGGTSELCFTACRMWLATLQLLVGNRTPDRRPLVSHARRFELYKGWQQRVYAEVLGSGQASEDAKAIERMVGRPLPSFSEDSSASFCTDPGCRNAVCLLWRRKLAERGISGADLRPGSIYSDEFRATEVSPGVFRVHKNE